MRVVIADEEAPARIRSPVLMALVAVATFASVGWV